MLYPDKGSQQRVAKLMKAYLPERRLFWARQCAISALALRGVEKTRHSPWKQLALVGRDIASDLPLVGVLNQTCLDVVSARKDPEQAGIGWSLVIGILDQHSHLATDALQAYPHRQSQEIIRCTRSCLMLHRQIKPCCAIHCRLCWGISNGQAWYEDLLIGRGFTVFSATIRGMALRPSQLHSSAALLRGTRIRSGQCAQPENGSAHAFVRGNTVQFCDWLVSLEADTQVESPGASPWGQAIFA